MKRIKDFGPDVKGILSNIGKVGFVLNLIDRHNFESEIYGSEQKIKSSRAKKPSSRANKEIKEKDGAKKKKEKEEAIKDSKKNENKTLKRSKKVEEVEDNPDVIEIEVVKKCKLNSNEISLSLYNSHRSKSKNISC